MRRQGALEPGFALLDPLGELLLFEFQGPDVAEQLIQLLVITGRLRLGEQIVFLGQERIAPAGTELPVPVPPAITSRSNQGLLDPDDG
jgi:hypothetical protein